MILIILIILLIIYFYWNTKVVKEHFSFPELNVPNPFGNDEEVYNSGYGEVFYSDPESDGVKYNLLKNYAIINTDNIVLSESLNVTNNKYKKYQMGVLTIDDNFKNEVNSSDIKKHLNDLNEITDENEKIKILKSNLITWKDRYYDYKPDKFNIFKTPISPYFSNDIINVFLRKFNKYQKSVLTKEILIYYGKQNYNIYGYKIEKIEKNSLNEYIFTISIILFSEGITFAPVLYFKGLMTNEKEVKIFKFDIIGYMTTEKILMPSGKTSDEDQYILNDYYRKENDKILYNDIFGLNKKLDKIKENDNIDKQYVCMTTNANDILNPQVYTQLILPASNKNICEASRNYFGERKQTGIWDTPCQEDSDCIFYQSNKNYLNNYGKCKTNGYCELPLNMVSMGYKYYLGTATTQPLCYNCDPEEKWKPVTKIDYCCDKQYDKNKYPHLNGPDYVFKNDKLNRTNYYNFSKFKLSQQR